MPCISAISKTDLPDRIRQENVKEYVRNFFQQHFPQIDRMLSVFSNAEIERRNFCEPLEYYGKHASFKERNDRYIIHALNYSAEAAENCIRQAEIKKEAITDIIFISTTGLATPSIDALIINKLRLNPHIRRTPVFGLGCAGGVAGLAKAAQAATADPNAVVLLVAVELCSLCFMQEDFSKSNFIASSLFSDGIAACIVKGDAHRRTDKTCIKFIDCYSRLYYDSTAVMGWEFLNTGFKVVFSPDIPAIITEHIKGDISEFLGKHNLDLSDIKSFIFHPGGRKVIEAYTEALSIDEKVLTNTKEVLRDYGNMSSATVLYVFEKFLREGFESGYGLAMALGPGFSSEMALFSMHK
ncbi:MAG: type III polyketide synthase [Bacteroidia bacterium]